jgi:hypothetical protein
MRSITPPSPPSKIVLFVAACDHGKLAASAFRFQPSLFGPPHTSRKNTAPQRALHDTNSRLQDTAQAFHQDFGYGNPQTGVFAIGRPFCRMIDFWISNA